MQLTAVNSLAGSVTGSSNKKCFRLLLLGAYVKTIFLCIMKQIHWNLCLGPPRTPQCHYSNCLVNAAASGVNVRHPTLLRKLTLTHTGTPRKDNSHFQRTKETQAGIQLFQNLGVFSRQPLQTEYSVTIVGSNDPQGSLCVKINMVCTVNIF